MQYGVGYWQAESHTWGELIEIVNAGQKHEREFYKNLSSISFIQAQLTGTFAFGGGKDLMVQDVFPYWTEEEKKEALLEKYKARMYRHASADKVNK